MSIKTPPKKRGALPTREPRDATLPRGGRSGRSRGDFVADYRTKKSAEERVERLRRNGNPDASFVKAKDGFGRRIWKVFYGVNGHHEIETRREGTTPARFVKRGRKIKQPTTLYITLFRARGSVNKRFFGFGATYRDGTNLARDEEKSANYFRLQSQFFPDGFPDSPGEWNSTEGAILGQVNFPGRVPLKVMIEMLNNGLNLREGKGDFRKAYNRWEYKYAVFEKVGEKRRLIDKQSGTDRN